MEEEELKNIENNDNSEKVSINNKNLKDSSKPQTSITKKDFPKANNRIDIQKKQNFKSDEINNRQKKVIKQKIIQDPNKKIKTNYDPQAYRVVIILKDADPTAPSQKFSNVLKNANILFEIEKIERFLENDLKNKNE
tara:strand:- start:168 stop:578 length:411 start_codon:yes stop_codon:yes gene_type:complete